MNIEKNKLVFRLSKDEDFINLRINHEVKNFIADLTNVDLNIINSVKDKFITFGKTISNMNGSFVVVSSFIFEESLVIVPTIQEAYDYIEMEEMERQLKL